MKRIEEGKNGNLSEVKEIKFSVDSSANQGPLSHALIALSEV